jgi:hypothetical protein
VLWECRERLTETPVPPSSGQNDIRYTGHVGYKGSTGTALLFLQRRRCTGWQVNTRYLLNCRLNGRHGRHGRCEISRSQPGSDPRTVQPVGSRYTDWAIADHNIQEIRLFKPSVSLYQITRWYVPQYNKLRIWHHMNLKFLKEISAAVQIITHAVCVSVCLSVKL